MKHTIVPMLVAFALLPAGAAQAQQGQGMVMQALSEPFSIELTGVPVTEALRRVSTQTGLDIRMSEDVYGWLPHGEQTHLRIKARQAKLADALTAMFKPMNLRWRVQKMGVTVFPSDELVRINRRPTFTEAGILHKLATVKIRNKPETITELRRATDVEELTLLWHAGDEKTRGKARKRARKHLPCTGAEFLDWLCHGNRWTWYLWGTELKIVTRQMQTSRQLERPIVARYTNQPLLDVLRDIARRADLKLQFDPGVLKAVGDQTRKDFTIVMSETTVGEAFQAISGATGLTFTPGDLAVDVGASAALTATGRTTPKRKRSAFLAAMQVADKTGQQYLVVFRPDELPAELVKQIEARKADHLANLQKVYGDAAAPGPPEEAKEAAPAAKPAREGN